MEDFNGHLYVLEDKTPVRCTDVLKWAAWYETANRIVASTMLKRFHVSTVFLGVNTTPGTAAPMLFETMIFAPYCCKLDRMQVRCSTWGEAEKLHLELCKLVCKHLAEVPPVELSNVRVNARGKILIDKNRAFVIRLKTRYAGK